MKNFMLIGIETGTDYREAVICKADNDNEAFNKGLEYFKKYKWELGIQRIDVTKISNDYVNII